MIVLTLGRVRRTGTEGRRRRARATSPQSLTMDARTTCAATGYGAGRGNWALVSGRVHCAAARVRSALMC
jgi:hypothetical protein